EETLIHTSLQRGEKAPADPGEPFQRFGDKPLKRLDTAATGQDTSLKRGVNESESNQAGALQIGNLRFQNALARVPQATPPIWLMRQAGRYHCHYQGLRRQFSFMDLCKQPELAAHVALGPVMDFDFDAAILFSDLLFPLEALGMGLEYTDAGPKLGWNLTPQTFARLRAVDEAWPGLLFQGEAMRATRQLLPNDKSLIGFVGGPWTLFVYAVEGTHKNVERAKQERHLFEKFCQTLVPLLIKNIELQFANGAEVVMIFDTAAGELASDVFKGEVVPQLERLTQSFPSRLGYYSKATTSAHLNHPLFTGGHWAGLGVDHNWDLREAFEQFPNGFVQGNFDQNLLLTSRDDFKQSLERFLAPLLKHDRTGWICGLGHGVLPKTPEENVRHFVNTVREVLQ
ncbi:MAG TPA: uroporphyrinogen decarboxylase family protein, partial [Pyrinomonadaceae bacterium]